MGVKLVSYDLKLIIEQLERSLRFNFCFNRFYNLLNLHVYDI